MYTKVSEQDFGESTETLAAYQYTKAHCLSCGSLKACSIRQLITLERLIIVALLGALIFCLPSIISPPSCSIDPEVSLRKLGGDTDYMTLDHTKDHLWASLTMHDTSGNAGLVWAADGNLDGEETVGMISMFHQLHCLTGLRTAIQAASEGKFVGVDQNDDAHWPHCMDYLRQTLLCKADDTIERPPVINGTLQHFINGVEDLRKCGQTKLLYDRAVQKAYKGSSSHNHD